MAKRKATAQAAKTQKSKSGKWKLLAGFVVLCLLVSFCTGGNKSKSDSSNSKEEQQATEQVAETEEPQVEETKTEEPQVEEAAEKPANNGELFIQKYNESCRTEPIQAVEEFIPKQKGYDGNPYYRSEFRLNAYKDTLGIHCSIGEPLGSDSTVFKSMDIVYWPKRQHYRVYVHDTSGEFTTAFIDVIKLLNPTAFSDEFLVSLAEAIDNGAGLYDIQDMVMDENDSMFHFVIYEGDGSGIVEGNL